MTLTTCLVSLIALTAISLVVSFEVVAEWTVLDYEWDATHTYENYINTSQFVPANCTLTFKKNYLMLLKCRCNYWNCRWG
jgi:hypothetical protein